MKRYDIIDQHLQEQSQTGEWVRYSDVMYELDNLKNKLIALQVTSAEMRSEIMLLKCVKE